MNCCKDHREEHNRKCGHNDKLSKVLESLKGKSKELVQKAMKRDEGQAAHDRNECSGTLLTNQNALAAWGCRLYKTLWHAVSQSVAGASVAGGS